MEPGDVLSVALAHLGDQSSGGGGRSFHGAVFCILLEHLLRNR